MTTEVSFYLLMKLYIWSPLKTGDWYTFLSVFIRPPQVFEDTHRTASSLNKHYLLSNKNTTNYNEWCIRTILHLHKSNNAPLLPPPPPPNFE